MNTRRVLAGAGVVVAAVFEMTMLATLALFFHNIPLAHAMCIGASQAEYQRLFSQGGYAFIGTITDVHLDSTSTQNGMQTDSYTVKARVERAWNSKRGASTSFKSVVTHPAPASATGALTWIEDQPSPFAVGTHEAVFVWNNNGTLSSEEGGCSFNLHLNSQTGEATFIGQMRNWGFGEGDIPGNASDDWGTTAGTYCPRLSQTLVRGSSGNQVLELQKFLSDYYDIPPTTIQTGYFGRITQGYVIQFQKEQGLPSYGIAGSMTRAAIAKVCAGSNVSANFSASPTFGQAPISVTFNISGLDQYGSYSIEYGDGTSATVTANEGSRPADDPRSPLKHTYTAAGTYVAKLMSHPTGQTNCYDCAQTESSKILGTVTITITSKVTSGGSLYGTVTRVAGNCMPQVVMSGDTPSTSSCTRGPVSREILVYPEFQASDYIPTSQNVGSIYSYVFPSYSNTTLQFATPFTIDFYSITDAENSVLYFGDGSRQSCAPENGNRGSVCRITHRYTNAGRYVVELRDAKGNPLQRIPLYFPEGGIALVARTTSDANGAYRISVPPGRYAVYVQEGGSPYCGGTACHVIVGNEPLLHDIEINAASW